MNPGPFKFLDSYGKEDAATFFGREQETDELYARCTHAQTLVIYGRSGTGKTSLVQCGLRTRFDESDWLPIIIRRGADLNANLLNELRGAALTPSNSTDALELVRNVYLDHFVPVYLLFDQFEELFIFGDDDEQQQFITTARTLIEQEQHVRLLFIVREEYLAQFTAFEEQVPSILEHRMRVERMPRRRAAEVVEKLCATAGIVVGPGFAASLLDRLNTDGGGVELSYLQVLLDQCWKKREGEEPFSIALLDRIGQLGDVLGDLLDEQIGQCGDPRKAETLLKAFVSDQGTKRPLSDPEAEGWMKAMDQPMEGSALQHLLQELVDRRLLTERDESGRHELRHDALAARIFERITKVEKEVAEARTFVAQAHKQFTKRNQPLTRADLDYLRPYKQQLHLSDAEERFVEDAFADERAREDRARRKRMWIIGGLVALLAAVGLFTVRTVNALAKERRMSESVRLVQRADELVDSDPQAAYLLAERGFHLDPTLNAERAVMRAYNSLFYEVARFPGTAVLVAPDQRTFVSIDPLKSFSLCDTNGNVVFSHALVRPPQVGVTYVAGGRYLLNVDSTVHVFDLHGKLLFKCPLVKWHSYNDLGGFVAAFDDSLLLDRNGTLVRTALPTRLLKYQMKATAWSFGMAGSGSVYFVDHDSVGIHDPLTGRQLHVWGHARLLSNASTAPDTVQVVDGRIFLLTTAGLERFDPGTGAKDIVVPPIEDEMKGQWLRNGILMQLNRDFSSLSIWELNGPKPVRRSLNGFFRRYFVRTGNVLLDDINDTKGTYTLWDRSGKLIMRTSGRLIGTAGEEFLRARDHFVITSDASVSEDSVRVYRSDGTLAWSMVVPKITPHLWEERPSLTFEEVGDSVTVCYFHAAVINGRSLQECRLVRNGRTIFYTTKEPLYFYWDRFIFNVVGNDRVLLSRWREGFSLFRPRTDLSKFPGRNSAGLYHLLPAGVGYPVVQGGADDLRIELLLMIDDSLRRQQLDMRSPALRAALGKARSWDYRFTANGRIFRLWTWIDSLATGGRDFFWRTKDGSMITTKWTQGAVVYNQRTELHPNECVFRNDSVLLLDPDLKELLWAARLDGLKSAYYTELDRYVSLTGAHGHIRIIDLEQRTSRDLYLDTALLDPRIFASMTSTIPPLVIVESSEVQYLLTNSGNAADLIQRIDHGRPKNVVTACGTETFRTMNGAAYMNLSNATVHRAFGSYEAYGDFTRSHYRLDNRNGDLVLTPVTSQEATMETYACDGFSLTKNDEHLFLIASNALGSFDAHRAITSHRLVDGMELFPKDPATAIQLVREKKVYGEFWKYMNVDSLLRTKE